MARRGGWGLVPGELDLLAELGTDALLDRLVAPDANGVAPESSPWAHLEYTGEPENEEDLAHSPTITAAWTARVGSVNERPGITGISHFFEHMMFKGSPTIGTSDYEKESAIIDQLDEIRLEKATAPSSRIRGGRSSGSSSPKRTISSAGSRPAKMAWADSINTPTLDGSSLCMPRASP